MGYKNGPQRFRKMFNVSTVQFLTIKDSHFVLLNSMAMEGDNCSLCLEARSEIDKISGMILGLLFIAFIVYVFFTKSIIAV